MSLFGAMCWVGGWDFIGMAVAACWHVIRVRCTCVCGSNNSTGISGAAVYFLWFDVFLLEFIQSWNSFELLVFRGTYFFGPARLGRCFDWFYAFLLTENLVVQFSLVTMDSLVEGTVL